MVGINSNGSKLAAKTGVLFITVLTSTAALAGDGGILVFEPDAMAVPVFSGPMLIGLSILFTVIAFRVMRSGRGLNRVAGVGVLAAGALVSSLVGVDQVRSSGTYMPTPDQCNTGGQINFDPDILFRFENNCDNDLRIVRLESGCEFGKVATTALAQPRVAPMPVQECAEGNIVAANGACELEACPPD